MKFSNKRRYECIYCGSSDGFERYLGYEEYDRYGYCFSCNISKPVPNDNFMYQKQVDAPLDFVKYVDDNVVRSLRNGNILGNNFAQFLLSLFPEAKVVSALRRYEVYTGKGASTVFCYVDAEKKVRNAKIVHYHIDGKRNRDVDIRLAYTSAQGYQNCIFGEHLLDETTTDIRIVESEKTAVIASIVYPEYTWLSSGGATSLDRKRGRVLKNYTKSYKEIIYDSDAAGRKGALNAREILSELCVGVNLCDAFPDKNDGWDIADEIIERINLKKGRFKFSAKAAYMTPSFNANMFKNELSALIKKHNVISNVCDAQGAWDEILGTEVIPFLPAPKQIDLKEEMKLLDAEMKFEGFTKTELQMLISKLCLHLTINELIQENKISERNQKYYSEYTPF